MKSMKFYIGLYLSFFTIFVCKAQIPSYVPTSNLVGWYPFNGNANDESGNGNNGIVNGAVLTTNNLGNLNSAYHFDGSGQFIEIPHNLSFDFTTNRLSISFWVKVENFAPGNFSKIIISKQSGSGNTQSGFNVNQASQSNLGILVSSGGGVFGGANVPSNASNYNQFHHIVLIYDNDSSSAYLDGILQGNWYTNPATIGLNSESLLFGKANWNNINATPFEGILDDIGIWNRALSQQEVSILFDSTTCTKPSVVTLGTDRSTIMCPDDSVKIFIVNPTTSGLSYQWFRNNVLISNATLDHYYATDFARYKVNVSSGLSAACLRVSGLIEPTLTNTPAMTITPQGSTSICQGDSVLLTANLITGYNYQWKRYGVDIANATAPNFYAKQAGTYKVQITNAGGCSSISTGIGVNVTCRMADPTIQQTDILVFPNPANDNFRIMFNDIGEEIPLLMEVRDSNGKVIEKRNLSSTNEVVIDSKNLSSGIYSVRIIFESGDVIDRSVNVLKLF